MNVEAKGRYQVQKRITQHEQLRVIFGLMPAFVFINFAKIESRLKSKTRKKLSGGSGFLLRASFALCYINAKWHLSVKSLVGDFAPQSLEYFGNIRCGVCSEANTVLIMLHKSKGGKNGKKER